MKAFWILIISLIIMAGSVKSQSNAVYCTQEITWFGIDYSQADFINNAAFPNPYLLTDKFFEEWNNLVFNEPVKFDIAKYFNKTDINYSTSYINMRNKAVDIANHIKAGNYQQNIFNADTISDILSTYKIDGNTSGVGLVFIVNSYNKPKRQASYWVTFFDIKTKKVLLTKQIFGVPTGIGLRNYWANSFYNALVKSMRTMGFVF